VGYTKSLRSHFTSRRYANAVCCRRVSVRPSVRQSVCPPQAGIASKQRIEPGFFCMGASFDLSWCVCYKEIRVSPKIRVLPFGTLPQTLDLENFTMASRYCGQQNSSTTEPVDYPYDGRARRGWMHKFITRWSTVTL